MSENETPSPDWWKPFFGGLWSHIHRGIGNNERTAKDLTFIYNATQLCSSANILDVPCGQGRHSIALAKKGHQVTGVDYSENLLQEAQKRAKAEGVTDSIDFIHQDMRTLTYHNQFDLALCLWGSFGYFSDLDNANYLQRIAQALRPGGRFLLDLPVLDTFLKNGLRERFWIELEKTHWLEEVHWNHETSCIENRWVLFRDGQKEEHRSRLRMYSYHELSTLLQNAGFSSAQGYGSPELEPFAAGKRLYMVATK